MCVLAIDTAAQQCAAAILMPDGTSHFLVEAAMRGQPERLLPMIGAVLALAGAGYGDLKRVAVTNGPGSFTGLRVGLAAAKGLGLALSIPVIGLDSFTAFRASIDPISDIAATIIESRRDELYWQTASGETGCAGPAAIALHLQQGSIIAGDGAWRLAEYRPDIEIRDQRPGPNPVAIAMRALTLHPEQYPAEPIYVRPPDAILART